MLKKLKNLWNNITTPVRNENGNVLAVALVIVTVLAISVSTITGLSVNLATSTTNAVNRKSDENEAKALIRLAVSDFEELIQGGMTFETYTATYVNTPSLTHGVTVTYETVNLGLDGGSFSNEAYKFSYTLEDGRIISLYDYATSSGVQTVYFDPFQFAMATNGSLLLNSGFYGVTHQSVKYQMYGDSVYLSKVAPYVINGSTTQDVTSTSTSLDPVFTDETTAEIYYNNNLKYCGASTCFTTNGSAQPFVANIGDPTIYQDFTDTVPADQGTVGSYAIVDFFGEFNLDNYITSWVNEDAPRGANQLSATYATIESTINTNSEDLVTQGKNGLNYGSEDFTDITTNYALVDFSDFRYKGTNYSLVYFGPSSPYTSGGVGELHITTDLKTRDDGSLVVFGDLYLDGGVQSISGNIYVSGDLYVSGGTKDFEGSIIVEGQTHFNFDEGSGITTNGANEGFTLMARDNILMEEIYESHTPGVSVPSIGLFFYTEESIYIDAVNSKIKMTGGLFARASGVSGNDIFMNDDSTNPVRGIIVNSFYGYINGSGTDVTGADETDFRFYHEVEHNSSYQSNFINIPSFDSLVIDPEGDITFLTTEFDIS